MPGGMRGVVLTVRFMLELAMLTAFVAWGVHVGEGVWGIRLAIEFVLFGAATLALAAADQPALAVIFAVLAVVTSLMNAAVPAPPRSRPS